MRLITVNRISDRLNELRRVYKLNHTFFAEGCGLSYNTIHSIEKSGRISKFSLRKIVDSYGTTNDWLLFERGEMLPNGKKELIIDEVRIRFTG